MNELIGTVTLAYVEEDNRQRMIFRIAPLSTKEGFLFHGTKEEFPDDGSLRIVPDKREQGTFKERMRSLAGLCAISLPADGKEKMKIRQNRNYDPENGERNQNALYSDIICEFAEDGCFEVVEAGSDATSVLTPKVLVRKAMMLYGPLTPKEAGEADLSALKPFGNDNYLLQTIESTFTGKRQVYWNPEMVLNWKQHKSAGKRKEKPQSAEKAPQPAEKGAQPEKKKQPEATKNPEAVPVAPRTEKKPQPAPKADAPKPLRKEEMEKKPFTPAGENRPPFKRGKASGEFTPAGASQNEPKPDTEAAATEMALPIGESLQILDGDITFDQQLDRLEQPLSENANRLGHTALNPDPFEEPDEGNEPAARSNATKLRQMPAGRMNRAHNSVNVYQVVEQALRSKDTEEKPEYIENPIAKLRDCIDALWADRELRARAIAELMNNADFMDGLGAAFMRDGLDVRMRAAAEEQLSAITAERLELLMQLRMAQEDAKKYQQDALAKLSQKQRDETERIKKELERLRKEKNHLQEESKILSTQNGQLVREYAANHLQSLSTVDQQGVALSPVMGAHYDMAVLTENLRINLNDCGFSISEDDAQALLIAFGLFDVICLKGETPADAFLFAGILLGSLGLNGVSAVLHKGTRITRIETLKNNPSQTPTVSIQPLGTDRLCAEGHKLIYIASEAVPDEDRFADLLCYPVIHIPAMAKDAYSQQELSVTLPEPAALSSFNDIGNDAKKLLSGAEKWFGELQSKLSKNGLVIPETMYAAMRRFVAVASGVLRGGFPVAADTAMCLWIVPAFLKAGVDPALLGDFAGGLTKTMTLLRKGNTHD